MNTCDKNKLNMHAFSGKIRELTVMRSALSCCAILGIGLPVNSYAQGDTGAMQARLEEVIVTATRRTESLQSIPASISVVSAADLDKRGIIGFQQVSETVAGLWTSKPSYTNGAGVYLRGVGTSGTSPAAQSVGIVVDGVYQIRQGAAFTELMDIDRVEVLRGPQGTLFGRNTTAGVIRIVTADPDHGAFSGRVQGVAGNLDARELRGVVNIPLIEDKMAFRLSGYTAKRDGYTKNLYLNEDTRNEDRQGWRAKLLWDVTDNFSVKLSAERSDQQSNTDGALSEYSPELLAQFPILEQFPVGIGRSQQQHEKATDDVERYAVNLRWDFLNHTLETISSWDTIELFMSQDRDRTILDQQFLTNLAITESETHEVQLSSRFEGPLNYVAGFYWQNEDLYSESYYLIPGLDPHRSLTLTNVTNQAIFGTVFYDFNDQWSASLGVRYTEDERQGANSQFSGVQTFYESTYSAKLMYHIDPDKMIYIAHDKGFKSGGINREFGSFCDLGIRCVTPEESFWDPETTLNYEIGIKSQWLDNRLRLNGALFYQNYEDFQVTQNLIEFANVLVLNAAKVKSMGVEFDFVASMTDNLIFDGSLAYVISEYDKFSDATCVPGTPACDNGFKDLSGEQLDNAPKLAFNFGAEYRADLAPWNGVDWFARLDTIYKSSQNLFYEQYPQTRQGSYYLLNGRIGIEANNGWKVTIWGNNLTDKDYLAGALLDTISVQKVPGLGRTYGVTLDYSF